MNKYIVMMRIIFIMCGGIVINSFCMDDFRHLSLEQYKKEQRKISKKYDEKLTSFIEQITEDNASEKLDKINRKLQYHKQNAEHQKEIALSAVKIKHAVDDVKWGECMIIMQEIQNRLEKCMATAHIEAVHDDTKIPQWFLIMLKKQLVDIGINPQIINISCSTAGAEEVGVQYRWSLINGLLSVEITGPGVIDIARNTLNVHDRDAMEGKVMLLAHMIKILNYSIFEAFGIKIKEKEKMLLSMLKWQQATLNVVLQSQRGARCINLYLKNNQLNFVTIDICKQINSINFCWKALKWLNKYYSINAHNIPLFLAAKHDYVPQACNLLDAGMVVTHQAVEEVQIHSPLKELLEKKYKKQKCCSCLEHPEDMRDVPCISKHIGDFICRVCYNKLDENELHQKKCPICREGCYSYNKVSI